MGYAQRIAARKTPCTRTAGAALSGFASGTRIMTPGGYRRVETLAAGDRVTGADGAVWPILWSATTRAEQAPVDARPVHVPAGALGAARDLRLAPGTGVVLDAARPAMVPARWLAEQAHAGIRTATEQGCAIYHHLFLPRHGVVMAEGLEVASFHPTPEALAALDDSARRSLYMLTMMAGMTGPDRALRYGAPAVAEMSHAAFETYLAAQAPMTPGATPVSLREVCARA